MQKTWVRSLGREDPLEKEMATHSSVLAWRIPGTGEPGGLPSMGSHRVGHDWSDFTFTFFQFLKSGLTLPFQDFLVESGLFAALGTLFFCACPGSQHYPQECFDPIFTYQNPFLKSSTKPFLIFQLKLSFSYEFLQHLLAFSLVVVLVEQISYCRLLKLRPDSSLLCLCSHNATLICGRVKKFSLLSRPISLFFISLRNFLDFFHVKPKRNCWHTCNTTHLLVIILVN